MTFEEFNFEPGLAESLDAMGFVSPTPIQEQAIPEILKGNDMLACAQTGTGKTAAFLLPVINKIIKSDSRAIQAIIVVPTRELALQIDQQLEGFAYFTGVSSVPVYGGGDANSFDVQKKAIEKGTDILVATPGRLIAHLGMDYVKLDGVRNFILDEADRMLDMGFLDDIMKIYNMLPKEKVQGLMFSATMPPKIRELTSRLLTNPKQINIAISKPAEGVLQGAYSVYDDQKIDLIVELIAGKQEAYSSILIFSSTKRNVEVISRILKKKGLSVRGISSDLEQKERETVLREFRNRKIQILVATDILSRGIDIKEISLVINYDVPQDAEDYVHRVGRTARASTTGVALTFINKADQYKFGRIEKLIGSEVKKIPLPAGFKEGPVYNPKGGGNSRSGGFRKKKNFRKKPGRK